MERGQEGASRRLCLPSPSFCSSGTELISNLARVHRSSSPDFPALFASSSSFRRPPFLLSPPLTLRLNVRTPPASFSCLLSTLFFPFVTRFVLLFPGNRAERRLCYRALLAVCPDKKSLPLLSISSPSKPRRPLPLPPRPSPAPQPSFLLLLPVPPSPTPSTPPSPPPTPPLPLLRPQSCSTSAPART